MIDFNKACRLVKNENPEMKPISCVELENFYAFNMTPKNCVDGMFANSCSYLIDKKTGEHRIAHFAEVNKELLKVLSEIEKRTTYF